MLALALLPPLLLAIVVTVQTFNSAADLADRTLISEAMLSVGNEKSAFVEARRTIETVARLPKIVESPPHACRETLANIQRGTQIYSRMAVFRRDGTLVCDEPQHPDASARETSPALETMAANPRFIVTKLDAPDRSGDDVVAVLTPIFDAQNQYAGAILAALRVVWFERFRDAPIGNATTVMALLNHDGALIADTNSISGNTRVTPPEAIIRPFLGPGNNFFTAPAPDGTLISYAVTPLVEAEVFLLIGMTNNSRRSVYLVGLIVAVAAPLVMYALALSVAWYAVDRLVLRHIDRLRRVAKRIEEGEESVRAPKGAGAPEEIEILMTSMNTMLDALEEREEELALALVAQKAFTKEIYHRVKNNLQIISSLINLQVRSAKSEASEQELLAAQKRILAMSTVYEQLHGDENFSRVRLDTLLRDLTRTIQRGLSQGTIVVPTEIDVAPVTTDPDRAIPLALLFTEALTNAYENSSKPDEGGFVRIALTESQPGFLNLVIDNKQSKSVERRTTSGLGIKLINVLSRQLRGSVNITQNDEYRVDITFPNLKSES